MEKIPPVLPSMVAFFWTLLQCSHKISMVCPCKLPSAVFFPEYFVIKLQALQSSIHMENIAPIVASIVQFIQTLLECFPKISMVCPCKITEHSIFSRIFCDQIVGIKRRYLHRKHRTSCSFHSSILIDLTIVFS